MKEIYVLGTSADLLNLNKKFFDENVTVGINQSYERAADVKSYLSYWITLDESMRYFDFMVNSFTGKTVKYVPALYFADPRFNDLFQMKCKQGHRDLRVYSRVDFYGKFNVCNVDKMDGIRIDVCKYTIFSAISLALGLGAEKIILRGVNLLGNYFDKECPDTDGKRAYFNDVRETLQVAKSLLAIAHIELENQSYQ